MKASIKLLGKRRKFTLEESPFLSTIGIIFGVFFFLFAIIYTIIALYMIQVLAEIERKDFSPANLRIEEYARFFEKLKNDHFEVMESEPYIKEGVKYFLWTVVTPDGKSRLIYRWKHDLESNRVEPMTSPATHLDVSLGHIKKENALDYPYNPDDELAEQIAKGTYKIEELSPPEEGEEEEKLEEEKPVEEQTDAEKAEEAKKSNGSKVDEEGKKENGEVEGGEAAGEGGTEDGGEAVEVGGSGEDGKDGEEERDENGDSKTGEDDEGAESQESGEPLE